MAYVKVAEISAVAARRAGEGGGRVPNNKVCEAFRDLIKACSASTFVVRAKSFTETELDILLEWEMEMVRYAFF